VPEIPYKKKECKPPIKKGKIRREKPRRLKPKEHGDMPQHRHYLPAKRREDRNPKYHEEL
jgi:hypothetical protein